LNYEDYPVVKLRSLDKITARTMTFEAKVGTTVRFGEIFIKVQSCRKPPPVEKSEAAAFLQIWQTNEKTSDSKWIFSGWMFASSPALSAMDHPVYDVWVLDCLGRDPEPLPAADPEKGVQTPPTDGNAPDAVPPTVEPDKQAPTAPTTAETQDDGTVTPQDDPGAFEDAPVEQNPNADTNAPAYTPEPARGDEYHDDTPTDDSSPVDDTVTPQVNPAPATEQPAPAKQEFQGIY
jgi:hypothetical protein